MDGLSMIFSDSVPKAIKEWALGIVKNRPEKYLQHGDVIELYGRNLFVYAEKDIVLEIL